MAAVAPKSLGDAGRRVWKSIASRYELRADELVTLEDACRTSDMIDALEKLWLEQGGPATTTGSMGQEVIHPLIGEIRTQRMARNALWRQLKLPDIDAKPAVNQNRAAAAEKHAAPWSGRGA